MNERSHELMAFLLGATAGGVAALLLSPASGPEVRHKIGETAEKAREQTKQRLHATGEAVTHGYEEATERAHRLVTGAKGSAESYRHAVAEAVKEGVKVYEREVGKAS